MDLEMDWLEAVGDPEVRAALSYVLAQARPVTADELARGVQKLCQYPQVQFINSIRRRLGFARLSGGDRPRPVARQRIERV